MAAHFLPIQAVVLIDNLGRVDPVAAQVIKGLAVIIIIVGTLSGPFGALHGGYYLLKGCLGPLLEQGVHTFVQVV